jgi:cation/acetate symporter
MLIALAFSVAASVNFPILILALYWRGLTTRGALVGGAVGLLAAATMIVLGPTVWVAALHHKAPIFPIGNPTLFSMTLAFLACWAGSVTDRSARAANERARFDEQWVRSTTGIGASVAVAH